MTDYKLQEIHRGRVVIGHHLKTNSEKNCIDNNKLKREFADNIVKRCIENGWDATIHIYPENGYCSELDGNWAYPITIVDNSITYTYLIFSMNNLKGNYGSPFYNRDYYCLNPYSPYFNQMNHRPMSMWSKYNEFTDIVKEIFGDCTEITNFVVDET
jgi:hypothetical protein